MHDFMMDQDVPEHQRAAGVAEAMEQFFQQHPLVLDELYSRPTMSAPIQTARVESKCFKCPSDYLLGQVKYDLRVAFPHANTYEEIAWISLGHKNGKKTYRWDISGRIADIKKRRGVSGTVHGAVRAICRQLLKAGWKRWE